MARTSEVKIKITLDDDNVPDSIFWLATESSEVKETKAKAILISIFEEHSKDTLKLDLWTKDMQLDEMDRFMFHTLRSLCETYAKATNNTSLSNDMMNFVQYFGDKISSTPPNS